jgi:membrane protease YdiL (CAAX protease family)
VRVSPRPLLGLIALAAYLVIIVAIQGTSGVPYTELSASAANLWRDPILSIAVASVVVVALATWWGWWQPALFERTRARRWTIIAPAFVLVLALLNLVFTEWGNIGADFLIAGLVVGVLVGFGEELTTRGLLLVGLRARLREVLVWLSTCLAFGLIHSVNILLGAPVVGTLQQIVLAASQGSAFYALRRVTGSLIWAMALHGLWDFSVFVLGASGGANPLGILTLVSAVVSVVFGFLATKDPNRSAPVQS